VSGVRLLYTHHRLPGSPLAGVPHIVALAAWPFDDPRVLDCITPLLVALSRRDDLEPVFSFDEAQLWPRVDARPLPSGHLALTRWLAVQQRHATQSRADGGDATGPCRTPREPPRDEPGTCTGRAVPASRSRHRKPRFDDS
jgi:hypothetical protein